MDRRYRTRRSSFRASRIDGVLAIDFANTVACDACGVGDALRGSREFEKWLRARPEVGVRSLTDGELTRLRAFRRDLRATLRAAARQTRPPSWALGAVNRAARRFRRIRALRWRGGTWAVEERKPVSDPVVRLTGELCESAFGAITGKGTGRLRECQGSRCAHFILARTRAQLWCSPTGCGNRARVARHYWRSRSRTRRTAAMAGPSPSR